MDRNLRRLFISKYYHYEKDSNHNSGDARGECCRVVPTQARRT